jgi:hypothetical protein
LTATDGFPLEGGCDCGQTRYRMETAPLFVHCCHCRWCQRGTGSAFALNAMIESGRVTLRPGEPEIVHTPSASGAGQKIARCPVCRVAVWSHYAGSGPVMRFVRVGTLDHPDLLPPDVHIFTASKQPWVVLPPDAVAMAMANAPALVASTKVDLSAQHLQQAVDAFGQWQGPLRAHFAYGTLDKAQYAHAHAHAHALHLANHFCAFGPMPA